MASSPGPRVDWWRGLADGLRSLHSWLTPIPPVFSQATSGWGPSTFQLTGPWNGRRVSVAVVPPHSEVNSLGKVWNWPGSLSVTATFRAAPPGQEGSAPFPWFWLGPSEVAENSEVEGPNGPLLATYRAAREALGRIPKPERFAPLTVETVALASSPNVQALLRGREWTEAYAFWERFPPQISGFKATSERLITWPWPTMGGCCQVARLLVQLAEIETVPANLPTAMDAFLGIVETLEPAFGATSPRDQPLLEIPPGSFPNVPPSPPEASPALGASEQVFVCPRCRTFEPGDPVLGRNGGLLNLVSRRCRVPLFRVG